MSWTYKNGKCKWLCTSKFLRLHAVTYTPNTRCLKSYLAVSNKKWKMVAHSEITFRINRFIKSDVAITKEKLKMTIFWTGKKSRWRNNKNPLCERYTFNEYLERTTNRNFQDAFCLGLFSIVLFRNCASNLYCDG